MLRTSFCAVPEFNRVEAGDELRTHHHLDRRIRHMAHGRALVARQRRRERAALPGFLQRADHVRGPPGGSDSDDGVRLGHVDIVQVACPGRCVVLGVLHRVLDRFGSACDQPDDESRRGAECRWALTGIEHTQTTGRPGSHIQKAASALEPLRNGVDGVHNGRAGRCDGGVYSRAVGEHGRHEFFGAQDVQVVQAFGGGFGLQSG